LNGRKTTTGERFSSRKMTAAAKDLPLGSKAIVTNLNNGRSAEVKINDCLPPGHGRKVDLAKGAARKLGMIHPGTAAVKATVVSAPVRPTYCD
jgi:rare lipoprotein A